MALATTRFDIQDHLKTAEERAAYLAAARECGEAEFLRCALDDVAAATARDVPSRMPRR